MQHVISTNEIRTIQQDAYVAKEGLISKFMKWCDSQQQSRLLWLGIAVLGGIATVLPLTLLAVVFLANNSLTLWAIACSFNVMILVVNLAAQPTKITLPVLFSVWVIDALIIFYSAAVFFQLV